MRLEEISAPGIFGDRMALGGELYIGEGRTLPGIVEDDEDVPVDVTHHTFSVTAEAYTADGQDVRSLTNWTLMVPQPPLPVTFAQEGNPTAGGNELVIPTTIFSNVNVALNATRELPVLVLYLKVNDSEGNTDIERMAVLYRRGG